MKLALAVFVLLFAVAITFAVEPGNASKPRAFKVRDEITILIEGSKPSADEGIVILGSVPISKVVENDTPAVDESQMLSAPTTMKAMVQEVSGNGELRLYAEVTSTRSVLKRKYTLLSILRGAELYEKQNQTIKHSLSGVVPASSVSSDNRVSTHNIYDLSIRSEIVPDVKPGSPKRR